MSENFQIEADGSRLRTLLKPIHAHGGRKIGIIRLRPPTYRDFMSFGDPSALIVMQNAMLPHEDMGIVEKYITALAVDENGDVIIPGLMEQIDYRDAIALKDAVLDFFKAASRPASSMPRTT